MYRKGRNIRSHDAPLHDRGSHGRGCDWDWVCAALLGGRGRGEAQEGVALALSVHGLKLSGDVEKTRFLAGC